MKSFVKFKYDRKDLHESPFVGGNTGQAAQTAANNAGLRKTLNRSRSLDPKRSLPMSPKKPLAPNVSGGESVGPQMRQRAKASGQKAGPAPTGIAAVMNRTKKKLQKQSNTETGRKVGRALQGVGKEIIDYKADRERTDTGAGGMGTALRQTGGITRAAVQGAMKAPSERINPKQKKTLGGKLGLKAKERFQRAIGVKPTARTEFGGKMTGDTSKQAERERIGRLKKGVTQSVDTTGLSKAEKQKKQQKAVSAVDVSPTGDKADATSFGNRLTNRNPKDKGKTPVSVDVTGGRERKTDDPSQGDQKPSGGEQQSFLDKRNRIKKQFSKGDKPVSNVNMPADTQRDAVSGTTPPKKDGKDEKDNTDYSYLNQPVGPQSKDSEQSKKVQKELEAGRARRNQARQDAKTVSLGKGMEVVSQGGEKKKTLGSGKKPEGQTIDVKPVEDKQISGSKNQKSLPQGSKQKALQGSKQKALQGSNQKSLPPAKTKTKEAKVTKFKRRNVKSPEFKTDGKFDQKKYDAAKGRTTTKSGGGRPRKIVEANRIAAEKEIKKQYGSVANAQMRSYAQMQKDKQEQEEKKKRKTSVMVTRQESYSHWREEFIWETDKKYPDKVKEIKPMSGKNTITINPEDETSKYKRGY